MIMMKVKEVVLDQAHNPLLLLVDEDEERVMPISIGFWEAQAIMMKLQQSFFPRPMTHDLMSSLCEQLGATLQMILINDIRDDTFFAEMHLIRNGNIIIVDARPSDAVALALTVGAPIYISEKVDEFTITMAEFLEEKRLADLDDSSDEEGPLLH